MSARYEKRTAQVSKALRSKKPEHRRKAARLAGELGMADQIPALIALAEKDKDAEVRKNATYALGMFAAFRDAINSDDEARVDEAYDAVEKLAETGTIGKSVEKQAARLRNALIGLSVLLVLLLAANVGVFLFLPDGEWLSISLGGGGSEGRNNAPSASLVNLAESAQAELPKLTSNADTLQRQYQAAVAGDDLTDLCSAFYDVTVADLVLTAEEQTSYPQLATLYNDIASANDTLNSARTRFEQACFDEMPLTDEEASGQLRAIEAIQDDLPTWEASLAELLIVPTDTPPPTATATEPPTLEPTATPDLRQDAAQLLQIIDTVTGPRGASTLLTQSWEEAQQGVAQAGACRRASVPSIPENYVLNPAIAESSEELNAAAAQVNTGLQVLRDGWQNFQQACDGGSGSLSAGIASGLQVSITAQTSFNNADQLIAIVLGTGASAPASTPEAEGGS